MRSFLIFLTLLFSIPNIFSQTLISTSNYKYATANHNQRKIVRDKDDNIFVVFVDSTDLKKYIKGISFNRSAEAWSTAEIISMGSNPTLSIYEDNRFALVYESNDSIPRICYSNSEDFTDWNERKIISDTTKSSHIPIADVDSSGFLNIMWREQCSDTTQSVVYCVITGDTIKQQQILFTQEEINDIAIANHLQYRTDDLLYAIQFQADSIMYFRMQGKNRLIDTLYHTNGSQPCITYNDYGHVEPAFRMIYLDKERHVMEVEILYFSNEPFNEIYKLSSTPATMICIDDIAPPIGYSFLCMQNNNLYHGFSYGGHWSRGLLFTLDTISSSPQHPSIAYKHFNFENIDFIWMEENGDNYNIYHKRDAKHMDLSREDNENLNGFTITGYPNPFRDHLIIKVSTENQYQVPGIEIYDVESRLVEVLNTETISGNTFTYTWNGTTISGRDSLPGVYIIMCTVENNRVARKVIRTR